MRRDRAWHVPMVAKPDPLERDSEFLHWHPPDHEIAGLSAADAMVVLRGGRDISVLQHGLSVGMRSTPAWDALWNDERTAALKEIQDSLDKIKDEQSPDGDVHSALRHLQGEFAKYLAVAVHGQIAHDPLVARTPWMSISLRDATGKLHELLDTGPFQTSGARPTPGALPREGRRRPAPSAVTATSPAEGGVTGGQGTVTPGVPGPQLRPGTGSGQPGDVPAESPGQ